MPCNQFDYLEPGDNATEIMNGLKYVRPGGGYEPKFMLLQKHDINGDTAHALYKSLKTSCPTAPVNEFGPPSDLMWSPIRRFDISWNFEKFLLDKTLKPLRRYDPSVNPLDMKDDIRAVLAMGPSLRIQEEQRLIDLLRRNMVEE